MIDYTAFTPLVKRVADSVHSSFPAHHSREDTESALWIWLFENKNTIMKYVHDVESLERKLHSLMTKAANAHLRKEDAAVYGYSNDDVFNYGTDLVKTLLESVFQHEDWQSFGSPSDGQPKPKVQSNMTGDRLAMLADVKSAIEKLSDSYRQVLHLYYKGHLTQAEMAGQLGVTEMAVRKRLERAVQAIRKQLGERPYSELRDDGRRYRSGDRGPRGSASALAQIERDYEG